MNSPSAQTLWQRSPGGFCGPASGFDVRFDGYAGTTRPFPSVTAPFPIAGAHITASLQHILSEPADFSLTIRQFSSACRCFSGEKLDICARRNRLDVGVRFHSRPFERIGDPRRAPPSGKTSFFCSVRSRDGRRRRSHERASRPHALIRGVPGETNPGHAAENAVSRHTEPPSTLILSHPT